MRRLSALAVALTLPMSTVSLSGCKSGNAAQRLAETTAPTLEGTHGKCKPGNEASSSLVVEWEMGERAELEGHIKDRLVAVRYRNCEMELISNCSVAGSYLYTPVTPKSETVHITNADELYAKIPIGAVRLEGQLARAGELNVDMVLVGRHEADRFRFQTSDLAGRCDGATHIITALSVGAFVFSSGAGADIGASGGVKGTGVEAGVGSTAKRELLSRDGDLTACTAPAGVDPVIGPPPGCAALLEVEVVPIDRPEVQATTSNTALGQLTDTSQVAGVDMTTEKLDRQIKAMTFMALSGYVLVLGGIASMAIGVKLNLGYGDTATATNYGEPGSADRQKYITNYGTSYGLIIGGLGSIVLGATLGLVGTTRGKKLRNERSTRLAGVGVSPLPGGGVQVGASWRF